jgi:hypothetical protein
MKMQLKPGDFISIRRGAPVFELLELINKSPLNQKELWEVTQVGRSVNERIWVYYDSVIDIENELSDTHIELMRHCLGLQDAGHGIEKQCQRNYYVANEGCEEFSALEKLVELGLMARLPTPKFLSQDALLYRVTQSGQLILKSLHS